jgi:succinate dehydrogenase flavin-adding protein (antitoxin of CptAB toxin-antitoxin module)
MENYAITITKDKDVHHFEVGEYAHHEDEKCKYRVYENGAYVASFEQDDQDFLHICQNPGNVDEEVLHMLADKIEAHHPHGINTNIRKLKL